MKESVLPRVLTKTLLRFLTCGSADSQCDLALILLDARKGILPQTRRHTAIVRLMGICRVVVVVNKMDLVGWDELAFIKLQRDILAFAKPFGVSDPVFIPVSALRGDNVVHGNECIPWYTGPYVLEYLEGVEIDGHSTARDTHKLISTSGASRKSRRFPLTTRSWKSPAKSPSSHATSAGAMSVPGTRSMIW